MKRNRHIGISSNTYPLEAGDIAKLPDYKGDDIDISHLDDEIVILIRKNAPDTLLKGRTRIDKTPSESTVEARIAFIPTVPKWFIFPNFIRALREKFRYKGSGTYHIAPQALRDLGVERAIRNRSNAYKLRQLKFDDAQCRNRYENLYNKIKTNGYDDSKPMTVMLCRKGGMVDSLKQGHHRMGVCLECGISRITIQFSAAGYMPSVIAGFFKQWNGKSAKRKPI